MNHNFKTWVLVQVDNISNEQVHNTTKRGGGERAVATL